MDKKGLDEKNNLYFCTMLMIIILPIYFEIYLRTIGLGDPITYDSNYVYGYARKKIKVKRDLRNLRNILLMMWG